MAIWVVDLFPRQRYMSFGVLGCMATLIVEAALIANFVPSTNTAALQAAVAMFFVFQVFYALCLDGTQFSYLGEIFPTHLRAKGVSLGVAVISLMNIIWLQSAPTAFVTVGWKFYLALIIPGTIGGILMWIFFPDTKGLPLEEIAALFGDEDEVAVYQREIDVGEGGVIADHHVKAAIHGMQAERIEDRGSVASEKV
jgi:Sugar (and other) transporter